MSLKTIAYPRPTEKYLYVERVPVAGKCPRCGAEDLKRYPVIDYMRAWFMVKCQNCLYVVSKQKCIPEVDGMPPFRSVAFSWPASPAEGGKIPSETA